MQGRRNSHSFVSYWTYLDNKLTEEQPQCKTCNPPFNVIRSMEKYIVC